MHYMVIIINIIIVAIFIALLSEYNTEFN